MPFFNTPPGNSGNTPAAGRAAPQSAVGGISGLSGDQISALARALQARGTLTDLLERKKRRGGGLFDAFAAPPQQTIGFGIEE